MHCGLPSLRIGNLWNSGQSPRACSTDWQIRQGRGLTGLQRGQELPSCCFPFIILTRRTGDGEDDGIAYAETEFPSSEDEEGGGNGEEEGGKRSSTFLKLWWMKAQSCCAMYSTMNARGMT